MSYRNRSSIKLHCNKTDISLSLFNVRYIIFGCTVWIKCAASWENRIFAYAKTKTQISFMNHDCREADQRLCFCWFADLILQYLYFLNQILQFLANFSNCTALFVSETPKTDFLTPWLKLKLVLTRNQTQVLGGSIQIFGSTPVCPSKKRDLIFVSLSNSRANQTSWTILTAFPLWFSGVKIPFLHKARFVLI